MTVLSVYFPCSTYCFHHYSAFLILLFEKHVASETPDSLHSKISVMALNESRSLLFPPMAPNRHLPSHTSAFLSDMNKHSSAFSNTRNSAGAYHFIFYILEGVCIRKKDGLQKKPDNFIFFNKNFCPPDEKPNGSCCTKHPLSMSPVLCTILCRLLTCLGLITFSYPADKVTL